MPRTQTASGAVDRQVDHQLKHLEPLIGGIIYQLVVANNGEFELPAFRVRTPDGQTHLVCILRDDEGNGPGAVMVDA